MKGRPRLVEEGIPIYGPGSEATPDHRMNGNVINHSSFSSASASNDNHNETASSVTSPQHSSLSSLAAAAKSSSARPYSSNRPKGRRHASRFVIGGDNIDDSSSTSDVVSPTETLPSMDQHGYEPKSESQSYHQPHHPSNSHSFTVGGNQNNTFNDPLHPQSQEFSHHHHDTHYPRNHSDYAHSHQSPFQQNGYPLEHSHEYAGAEAEDHAMDHEMLPDPHHQAPPPSNHHHHHPSAPLPNTHHTSRPTRHATSYTIGADSDNSQNYAEEYSLEKVEKMEGVEDHGTKQPLVVLDGANVAYAYAAAMAGMDHSSSLTQASTMNKAEPDSRGIQVATQYFRDVGLRVLVVLPASWFRRKPRPGDSNQTNAMMETPQLEILHDLKAQGLLVSSPPTDDDDAYAILIARREQARANQRNGEGPGFVLSNDMFRDAQRRDPTGSLKDWLNNGVNPTQGPGRISYAFGDMGNIDDHGDKELDFVPNPRHPLVQWVESLHHSQGTR